MIKSGVLYIFFLITLCVDAQVLKQVSPLMEDVLEKVNEGERFSVFVSGQRNLISDAVDAGQIERNGTIGSYDLLSLDRSSLMELIEVGALDFVDLSMDIGRPLNDLMITNNNVLAVHNGLEPIGVPLTGEGVIIGILDTGIELDHPDFQWEDGSTRVLELWDHTYVYDEAHIPEPYGFGTLWTKEEIDAGLSDHEDQLSWYGHGSTVTGTACGDGSALDMFKGVAPDAEMVIVSFDFDRPGFLADVANSVQYIFDVAEQQGKPCVINTSLGTYYGSHDGLDPASLYIDSLIEAQNGRLLVAAVGNSHTFNPYHLHVEVDADTSFTWFESESTITDFGPGVYFDLWADMVDFTQIQFGMSADIIGESVQQRAMGEFIQVDQALGNTYTDVLTNTNGDELATVTYWAQQRGDQVQLQVYLPDPDSSQYAFRFMSTGLGSFDVWSTNVFGTSDILQGSQLPNVTDYPAMIHHVGPDSKQQMVSSWTCSEKVITVANYTNRTSYENYEGNITTVGGTMGEIASTSSSGPTRDGRQKPDLAATGSVTLSTGNFPMLEQLIANEPFKVAPGGMHFRNGGSSMASPVVAGIGALFLELCPEADWQTFKNALLENTALDDFTGAVPDDRWGMGKANAFGTLASLAMDADIQWQGDSLIASTNATYQWYLDGEPIPDEIGQILHIDEYGAYQVEVFNDLGCSRFSEEILVLGLTEEFDEIFQVKPNPSSGIFSVSGLNDGNLLTVRSILGKLIDLKAYFNEGVWHIDLSGESPGIYVLQWTHEGISYSEKLLKQ